ncbi:HNH endonuclease [Tateyamaria sp. Alg231-49]|uniref:HNH endonuclease n=1 Tax=Tateyamaria sp. Alg231-49 TaxID=1922219 RepID=UPI000D555511|nr:HNH endonuclease [Tateyamaria sp. Alg231-49]
MSKQFLSHEDFAPRDLEHHEVARILGNFSTAEFAAKYAQMYPERAPGSVLPGDYAYNNRQQARNNYPSFLEVIGRASYRFVGLSAGQAQKHGKNPDWTRDELILATEFYKTHAPKIPGKTDARLIALADDIRAVAHGRGLYGDETFRNPNGCYMKLMELRKYDPAYAGKGLGRKLRPLEQGVWDLPEDSLLAAAKHIREALKFLEESRDLGGLMVEYDEPEVADAVEGAIVTRIHRTRERDPKIVRDKKKQFLAQHGSLYCQACGFDFAKRYGPRGEGFIECHHTVPVSEMGIGAKTKLADLMLVCSNCHRMIHAKRPWLSPDAIKGLLTGNQYS